MPRCGGGAHAGPCGRRDAGPGPSPPATPGGPRSQGPAQFHRSHAAPQAKGSVLQGYNGQAAVDAMAQIILAADVTDASNDKQQAQPLLTQVLVNTGQVPRTVSLDAGYFSEANVTALTGLGV
jgi:hypothetical protein